VLRALRHRSFRLFFAGQLVSLIGTWMQIVAQSWLVYRLTGSSLLLGTIGFSTQIPVLLFAQLGGAVADRTSRHRMLLVTQTISMLLAFALAFLALTNRIAVWHVFVLAASLGVTNAFDIPARQAFVVEMVGKDDLMNAIALNSAMFNGARVLGPAIAGVLVGWLGEGYCFFANGLSFLAVIGSLLAMHVPRREALPAKGSTLSQIAEGFAFVRREPAVRALLLLLGLVSLTAMPYAVLMPVFADKILGVGARGLGLLMGAAGVGALFGTALLATRSEVRGLGRWIAAGAAAFGAALIAFALSRSMWLSVAFLVPAGFAQIVQMAGSNTLIQTLTPDALRGRVMASYSMMFMGSAPVGALLAGALADRIGAPAAVMAGGLACIAGACVFAWRLPRLREAAHALLVAQRTAAGEPHPE
jgi:MFS family permease